MHTTDEARCRLAIDAAARLSETMSAALIARCRLQWSMTSCCAAVALFSITLLPDIGGCYSPAMAKAFLAVALSCIHCLYRRYVFRFSQMLILAFVTATLFPKPRMNYDTVSGGSLLIGAIFFSLLQFLFDGAAEANFLWAPQPTHSLQGLSSKRRSILRWCHEFCTSPCT